MIRDYHICYFVYLEYFELLYPKKCLPIPTKATKKITLQSIFAEDQMTAIGSTQAEIISSRSISITDAVNSLPLRY